MRVPNTYGLMASTMLLAAVPAYGQAAAATTSLALKAMTYVGCFNTSEPLVDQGPYTFQTAGYCQKVCVALGKAVMATTGGSNCLCGDEIPAAASMVDDSLCNVACYGYNQDTCGGDGTYAVELTGITGAVATYSPSSSAAASSTTDGATPTTSQATVVTLSGQTVVVTKASETSGSATSSSKSGPNKAGIAAGVVVGVVVIAAGAGGAFLYFRRKRRAAVEEEYRRNAAIKGLGAKPGSVSSMSDSRLEPALMAQRRMSDGSIADNQDYSRRILKVMNPDGS